MRTWRQMDESEQTELILSGAELCVRCGGHGTITIMGMPDIRECYMCEGKGYITEQDHHDGLKRLVYEYCKDNGNSFFEHNS